MPEVLPRMGLTLRFDESLDRVRYYGRGPRENYRDRKSGSFFGIWDSTVDGLGENYVRPQDNGCRSDVRWVAFFNKDGKGVKCSASEPLFVQASPYAWEDLEFSRHRNGQQRFRAELKKTDWINVNLDVRQTGLGGASCGPRPMEQYLYRPSPEKWTVVFESFSDLERSSKSERCR